MSSENKIEIRDSVEYICNNNLQVNLKGCKFQPLTDFEMILFQNDTDEPERTE